MKDFLNSLLVLVSTSFNNCIKLNMVTTEILTSRQFNVYLTLLFTGEVATRAIYSYITLFYIFFLFVYEYLSLACDGIQN